MYSVVFYFHYTKMQKNTRNPQNRDTLIFFTLITLNDTEEIIWELPKTVY